MRKIAWSGLVASVMVGLLALMADRAYAADRYITDQWYGQYWNNGNLVASPVAIRNDPAIDFNWGYGQPDPLVSSDRFSARWTRSVYFNAGAYRFVATMDDAMRVWIDEALIIDEWRESAEHTVSRDILLSEGWHNIKVEYADREGMAVARFSWSPATGGDTYPNWKGEYFANGTLTGPPAVVRDDRYMDFDWGQGSPDYRVPVDRFSARWNKTMNLEPGQYSVRLLSDDGSRVYINDQLVLNNWSPLLNQTLQADYWHPGGEARIRVEYFEVTGPARLRFDFFPVPGGEGVLPPTGGGSGGGGTLPPNPDGTVDCPNQPTTLSGVVISSRPLNVRLGPSTLYEAITQLQPCQEVRLGGQLSSDGEWTMVMLDDGRVGWVLSQYLEVLPPGDPGGAVG